MITSAALDGLTIHNPASPTCPYSIDTDGMKGLGEPDFRISAYERAGEDGGFIAGAYLGMRPIAVQGLVKGADAATFAANRRALELTCSIRRDSAGRPILKTFDFTLQTGETFTVSAIPRKLIVGVVHNNYAPFMIEMLAPDPQLFAQGSLSSGQVSRPVTSGVTFPWIFDPTIEFGASTGGVMVLSNPGTTSSWPIVTFRGPLTNPVVTHVGQGKYMQLNATLGGSDVVVVDMKQKTIVLNGTSNYLATRTTDSDWFSVDPGTNVINFNSGLSSDLGTAEVTYSAGYLGV